MREVFPNNRDVFTPRDVLRHLILSPQINRNRCVVIILGRVGPTGKTWLYKELLGRGFHAIELTPSVYDHVTYTDDYNHLLIDDERECVTVILNRDIFEYGIE